MRSDPASGRRRSGGSSAGFSMVEMLVTMLILTIVLVGLAALQLQVVRGVTVSRHSDEATRLGQSVLERYMTLAKPLDGILGIKPPGACVESVWCTELKRDGITAMAGVDVSGESPGPFTVQSMIETYGVPATKIVTVRVLWSESSTGPGYNASSVLLSTRRAP
jgi:prepilin-type N-terminal cleavage/methylation domain-containing protein